jgi:EAL domain-containing protein (putative c-di-GMP-specific phosphodiesterase class I)
MSTASGLLRVLLVESDTGDGAVMRTYLDDQPLGPVEVTEVSSLAAACRELLSRPFDLVLVDLDLPDGRGVEVVARVREILDDVPFRAAFEQDTLTAVDLRALRTSLDRRKSEAWTGWYHVNVFPSTLVDTTPEDLTSLLVDAGTDERICIELSEQQFLGDPAYLKKPIASLRKRGFRVAIDDVGFGRSSIEALMVLEPDVVKIDRKCMHTAGGDDAERRQLERLIAMLGAVEATVIVEGVETQSELSFLREMGVQYAQGYLWGKPSERVRVGRPEERLA